MTKRIFTTEDRDRILLRRSERLINQKKSESGLGVMLDLPAEVRALIFTKLFDATPVAVAGATLPPIFFVSRQIYIESQKLFYQHTKWNIEAAEVTYLKWKSLRDVLILSPKILQIRGDHPIKFILDLGDQLPSWSTYNELWTLKNIELEIVGRPAEKQYVEGWLAMTSALTTVGEISLGPMRPELTVLKPELAAMNEPEKVKWLNEWGKEYSKTSKGISFEFKQAGGTDGDEICTMKLTPNNDWSQDEKADTRLQEMSFRWLSERRRVTNAHTFVNPFVQAQKRREAAERLRARMRAANAVVAPPIIPLQPPPPGLLPPPFPPPGFPPPGFPVPPPIHATGFSTYQYPLQTQNALMLNAPATHSTMAYQSQPFTPFQNPYANPSPFTTPAMNHFNHFNHSLNGNQAFPLTHDAQTPASNQGTAGSSESSDDSDEDFMDSP